MSETTSLTVRGLALTVERIPTGGWVAVYGGFSRASGATLADAVATATGARPHEPWLVELVARIGAEAA